MVLWETALDGVDMRDHNVMIINHNDTGMYASLSE